jgi:hypothetical protein
MTNVDDRKPSQTNETSQPAPAAEWAYTHDGDGRLARVSGYGRAQLELRDGSLHVGMEPGGGPSIVITNSSHETVAVLRLPAPRPSDVPSIEWSALFARVFGIDAPATPAEAEAAIAEQLFISGSFGRFDSGASAAAKLKALIIHSRAVSSSVRVLDENLGTGIEGELGNEDIPEAIEAECRALANLAAGRDGLPPYIIAEHLSALDAGDHSLRAEIIRARARWIPSIESKVGDGFSPLPRCDSGPNVGVLETWGGVVMRTWSSVGMALVFVAGETVLSMRQRFGYGRDDGQGDTLSSRIDPK